LSQGRPGGPPQRRPSKAAVLLDLLAFVEGLRTEDAYLTYWRRQYRDKVLIEIDPFRGGPLQLVQKAVEAKRTEAREARRGRGRPHDQIWCVFDRDEHPNFARAVDLANRNDINLAISNPCIELWFILHFERHTAYIERQAAQRRAEELLRCSKVLTDSALSALAEHYDRAREQAVRLDEKHAGDGSPPASNPSSGVWRLIDLIRTPDTVAALEADWPDWQVRAVIGPVGAPTWCAQRRDGTGRMIEADSADDLLKHLETETAN
jgi:RloB-like protein